MSLAADYHNTQYYQAPYRPITRSHEGTIRDGNTEWLKMLNRADLSRDNNQNVTPLVTSQIPKQDPKPAPVAKFINARPVQIGEGPGFIKERSTTLPVNATSEAQAPDTPYRPFEEKNRTDEYYRRYLQLSGNIAYKHPNPGYPRERQGAIGGSWRHIKEVLGYSGGQVCFVDGLVRLYDTDSGSAAINQSAGMRASMATPAYAANRHNVASYKKDIQRTMEQRAYKPWDDSEMPVPSTTPRQQMESSNSKYKGFYTLRE